MEGQDLKQSTETQGKEKYKSYLILHNVGKKKNVGTIIRFIIFYWLKMNLKKECMCF